MLHGLIGAGTLVSRLRDGLDESAVRTRTIADRVANATNGTEASFQAALDNVTTQGGQVATSEAPVDLETEMVRLADEQIRFQALSRILQGMYAQARSTTRST